MERMTVSRYKAVFLSTKIGWPPPPPPPPPYYYFLLYPPPTTISTKLYCSPPLSLSSPLELKRCFCGSSNNGKARLRAPASALPESRDDDDDDDDDDDEVELQLQRQKGRVGAALEAIRDGNSAAIISACLVGLLTGFCVVLFNNLVHELRDFFWDGIPYRGASWLREEPIETTWQRTILVPVCGGLLVSILNVLRDALDAPRQRESLPHLKSVLEPFLKTLAACITLGTGNSLGPEGPSVEIGSSIAKGVGTLIGKTSRRKVPLVAAGSAAGIASGFNAAVAGCFFAVESVLWPSPDASVSLTNTTSMVILSAVIASVLSEVGLGAQPAFKVPDYDFRSASELPLYILLGILCGLVSLALTRCTTFMIRTTEEIQKTGRVSKAVFPVTGGLAVGLMALAYPEILYWGFQNVDILLESRPFVKGLSADLLFQLVGIKIIATSFCRASGLVGGYYAPSLFIGAATGMAYGKFISFAVFQLHPTFQTSLFEVASPQAYGLDYRIVLPLLAAVGMSSWITSPRVKRTDLGDLKKLNESPLKTTRNDESTKNPGAVSSGYSTRASNADDICEVESSRCVDDFEGVAEQLERKILVSQAMRTRFAVVFRNTLLLEAVTLMLAEKQSYALIVDDDNLLVGMLSLEDILEFSKSAQARRRNSKELLVAELCSVNGKECKVLWTATPGMDLLSAEMLLVRHGLSQLPVVCEHGQSQRGQPVGVIDMQCIKLACRLCLRWMPLLYYINACTDAHAHQECHSASTFPLSPNGY